jgi:hypothetical protein
MSGLVSLADSLTVQSAMDCAPYAVVVENVDPMNQGRIKVVCAGVYETSDHDSLPWVYPKASGAAGGRADTTQHAVPEIGSSVSLVFPTRDIYYALYDSCPPTPQRQAQVFRTNPVPADGGGFGVSGSRGLASGLSDLNELLNYPNGSTPQLQAALGGVGDRLSGATGDVGQYLQMLRGLASPRSPLISQISQVQLAASQILGVAAEGEDVPADLAPQLTLTREQAAKALTLAADNPDIQEILADLLKEMDRPGVTAQELADAIDALPPHVKEFLETVLGLPGSQDAAGSMFGSVGGAMQTLAGQGGSFLQSATKALAGPLKTAAGSLAPAAGKAVGAHDFAGHVRPHNDGNVSWDRFDKEQGVHERYDGASGTSTRLSKDGNKRLALKSMELVIDGDMLVSVGGKLTIRVGDDLVLISGGKAVIKSASDLALKAGGDALLEGSGSAEVKAGGVLALNGSTVQENGGASASDASTIVQDALQRIDELVRNSQSQLDAMKQQHDAIVEAAKSEKSRLQEHAGRLTGETL